MAFRRATQSPEKLKLVVSVLADSVLQQSPGSEAGVSTERTRGCGVRKGHILTPSLSSYGKRLLCDPALAKADGAIICFVKNKFLP